MTASVAFRIAALVLVIQPITELRADEEIYRWTDESGRMHFTQSLDQVPAEQRAAARQAAEGEPGDRLDPLQRFAAPTTPRARFDPASISPRSAVRVPFERHGSLMKVVARLNDRLDVPFYVDSGASGVSLPILHARRLGIRIDSRTPRAAIQTAAGMISEPMVKIGSIELGGARVEGLEATVSSSMSVGLLGGSFFNNYLYKVDAAAGVITLQRNVGMRGGLREEQWRERFRSVRGPLGELEHYLASVDITRKGRREKLEDHRARLRSQLQDLEQEARRAAVPESWQR